jgi:hypothetical protein
MFNDDSHSKLGCSNDQSFTKSFLVERALERNQAKDHTKTSPLNDIDAYSDAVYSFGVVSQSQTIKDQNSGPSSFTEKSNDGTSEDNGWIDTEWIKWKPLVVYKERDIRAALKALGHIPKDRIELNRAIIRWRQDACDQAVSGTEAYY